MNTIKYNFEIDIRNLCFFGSRMNTIKYNFEIDIRNLRFFRSRMNIIKYNFEMFLVFGSRMNIIKYNFEIDIRSVYIYIYISPSRREISIRSIIWTGLSRYSPFPSHSSGERKRLESRYARFR